MILTKENYHSIEANRQYMSVSLFKELAFGCQAKQMAKLNGNFKEEQADALLIGQAVHSWNEGTYDRFMSEHPEMYKKDGTLYAKYEIIGDLIETLKNDASMLKALEGKKEVILTAEMFGVEWKIMIDSYNEEKGIISDLKTMKSIDDKFWDNKERRYKNFIEHYGYDIQMSVYAEIERISKGRENRFNPLLVIVTKENPPDKSLIYFPDEKHFSVIENKLKIIEESIDEVVRVWKGNQEPKRCGKCEYCRKTKQVDIISCLDI